MLRSDRTTVQINAEARVTYTDCCFNTGENILFLLSINLLINYIEIWSLMCQKDQYFLKPTVTCLNFFFLCPTQIPTVIHFRFFKTKKSSDLKSAKTNRIINDELSVDQLT